MLKSKTLYASLTAIIGALGAWQMSEISLAEMLQVCIPAVLAVTLRHSVAKVDKKLEEPSAKSS
jgi:uncharacterized membrane protein YeiH